MDAFTPSSPTRFIRRELKFLVDADQRRHLTARLLEHMTPDPHGDGAGYYPVVDLYFDNRFHDVYWDYATGIDSRQKLRLRVYGGGPSSAAPISFLELKHKQGGRVYKRRLSLPVDVALAVAGGAWPDGALRRAERRVVEHVHALVERRELVPSMVLRYDRQALRGTGSEGDLRVTFDTNVRFRLHDLVPQPDDQRCDQALVNGGTSIVEVKVDAMVPRWLADLVAGGGCVRQSFSKYCRAFESIYRQNGRFAAERLAWQAGLAQSANGSGHPLPARP